MSHANNKQGFTLIELMLAMGFVSALLIAIAMTIIQIGSIYNKGLTLKEVNQAGRSLTSEFQKSIAQNKPFNVNPGAGSRYITQPWGGRLCIGHYSYIWNYGVSIDPTKLDPNRNVYNNSNDLIRFIKVFDPNSNYCTIDSTTNKYPSVSLSNAVELLDVGEHNLAVHYFKISSAALMTDNKTGQQLYSIEFTIGTNDQLALTTSSTGDITCKAPSEKGADPAYCSVDRFNIVTLAGNSVQ